MAHVNFLFSMYLQCSLPMHQNKREIIVRWKIMFSLLIIIQTLNKHWIKKGRGYLRTLRHLSGSETRARQIKSETMVRRRPRVFGIKTKTGQEFSGLGLVDHLKSTWSRLCLDWSGLDYNIEFWNNSTQQKTPFQSPNVQARFNRNLNNLKWIVNNWKILRPG